MAVVFSRLAVTRAAERVLTPARIDRELNHGTTIFTQCVEGCRARNAQAQARNPQERQKRKKGQKPQAGHRHRPLGGAQGRKKGPAQIQIARDTERAYPRPSFTVSPRRFWPSASNAVATMHLASRPALAYIAVGESWSMKTSGSTMGRTLRPLSSAPLAASACNTCAAKPPMAP